MLKDSCDSGVRFVVIFMIRGLVRSLSLSFALLFERLRNAFRIGSMIKGVR